MRINLIEDIINKKRKVQEVATICNVSRKTIHKRKRRYIHYGEVWLRPKKPWPKKWTARNKTTLEKENIIIDCALHNRFDGPMKLKMKLEEIWVFINQSTIYRILKRRSIRYHEIYERPKKKKKLYVLDRPGRELQVDTSFPFWYSSKLVIYSAIDDCSRYIRSKAYWWRSLKNSIDFVTWLQNITLFPIYQIRTDQWREFSKAFTDYLALQNTSHKKNAPYHPEHNWKVERYHRTMKDEEVNYRPFWIQPKEANYKLWLRTRFYNESRRHTWLWMSGLTPRQKLEKCRKNVTLILQ